MLVWVLAAVAVVWLALMVFGVGLVVIASRSRRRATRWAADVPAPRAAPEASSAYDAARQRWSARRHG